MKLSGIGLGGAAMEAEARVSGWNSTYDGKDARPGRRVQVLGIGDGKVVRAMNR